MSKIIAILFVIFIAQVLGQEPDLNGRPVLCYEKECPSATAACKRVVSTSNDKKFLTTTISCLDARTRVLKDFKEVNKNPYDDTTTYFSEHVIEIDIIHDTSTENNTKPQVPHTVCERIKR